MLGHHQPTSETPLSHHRQISQTPFKWRFAGPLIVVFGFLKKRYQIWPPLTKPSDPRMPLKLVTLLVRGSVILGRYLPQSLPF